MSDELKIHSAVLGKKLMATIYEFVILRWEQRWQDANFDIRAKKFKEFEREINFKREALLDVVKFKERMSSSWPTNKNWIVFTDSEKSQAKSILKHLRHAAAHAHIEKITTTVLQFKSYNLNKKQVMQGQIEQKYLEQFLNALAETVKSK